MTKNIISLRLIGTLSLLLLLFQTPQILAQNTNRTYCYGQVVDARSNEALAGVYVYIPKTNHSCVTDQNGQYKLELPIGTHKIYFSHYAYQTEKRNLKVEQATQLNLLLHPLEEKLKDLVVFGKSKNQRMREVPASVSILSAKELEGKVISLDEALSQSSGIQVTQQGGLGSLSRILVQGLDGKRIGIFVNGVPLGKSEGFKMNTIPIDQIETVQVYKGIIPAWLGGDGLGGAVNIIMKRFQGQHLEASYEIGSYNTHKGNLLGNISLPKLGITIAYNGSLHYSKNNYSFMSPFELGRMIKRDHDQYLKYDFGGSISYSRPGFELLSLNLQHSYIYDEIQGGLMNVQNNVRHAHNKIRSYHAGLNISKKLLHEQLRLDFSSFLEKYIINNVDTSHLAYDFNGHSFKSPSIQGEIGDLPNFSKDKVNGISSVLNLHYRIDDTNELNWNTFFSSKQKKLNDPLADSYVHYPTSGYSNQLLGLVSGLSYQRHFFNGKIRNELGIKYFHNYSNILTSREKNLLQDRPKQISNLQQNFGWNEALAWQPNSMLTLKGSVQKAIRLPSSDEMFGDGALLYPSLKLKPEESFNINLACNAIFNFSEENFLRLDINSYYMDIQNMIKLMYSAMQMAYENVDHVKIWGIEGELNTSLFGFCKLKSNLSYLNARDKRKDAVGGGENFHYNYRIPNIPYFFGNAEFSMYKKGLLGKRSYTSLSLLSSFTEKFSYNWEASRHNTLIIPRKWNFNIALFQSFQTRYHLSFEVHNLFNTEQWAEFRYPLPGRTYHLKLKCIIR